MRHRRKQSGAFALAIVLLLMVIASVLGISYLSSSTVQVAGANNLLKGRRARYLAESGLEHAVMLLRTDPNAPATLTLGTNGPYQADNSDDSYEFTVISQGDGIYSITGIGRMDGVSQQAGMTVELSSSYKATMTELSPVAYWRLGEAKGTVAKEISDDNHGKYHSVVLGQGGALAGDADGAAGTNGTSSYVEVEDAPEFHVSDGSITLWFKPTGDEVTDSGLFSKDADENSSGGQIEMGTEDGALTVSLESTKTTYKITGGAIEADKWHYAVFTFGSGGMRLYVDGGLVADRNYTGGLGTTSGGAGNFEPIIIGASASATAASSETGRSGKGGKADKKDKDAGTLQDHFQGVIDEVAMFGKALSSKEIQQLYKAQVADVSIISWDR